MPVYAEGEQTPCAFITVQSLDHDYQTKAFFRIGFLPAIRAENVEFVVIDSDRLSEVLSGARPLFLSKGSRQSFEMHEVSFRFESESAPRLVAQRIRLMESGDWDLVDGCQIHKDGVTISLPRSRLTVTGPNVGTLTSSIEGGVRTFQPFKSTEPMGDTSQ